MAEAMSCTELHNMAKAYALQNFPEVGGNVFLEYFCRISISDKNKYQEKHKQIMSEIKQMTIVMIK